MNLDEQFITSLHDMLSNQYNRKDVVVSFRKKQRMRDSEYEQEEKELSLNQELGQKRMIVFLVLELVNMAEGYFEIRRKRST